MGKHYGELIIESVLEMKAQGYTHKEIGEKYGYSKDQIKQLVLRHNKKQRILQAGILLKKKGRPRKYVKITDSDKTAALKYELNRKEYKIKQLEMENELLRDFLKEAERG